MRKRGKILTRTNYLKQLKSVIGVPDMKVITGIRRSGKSMLMQQFREYVEENIKDANVIQFSLDLPENFHLLEPEKLYQAVSERYQEGKRNFLLIDEVQNCRGFERLMNGLHAEGKYDIYLTGSNAFLLSSDLATLFTGRTFEVKVYPFSYREFLEFFELEDSPESFEDYFWKGGMPSTYIYDAQSQREQALAAIMEVLLVRDIDSKYDLRDERLLADISAFLMDNISNQTVMSKIAGYLTAHGRKVSDKTVANYVKYLCDAFAFYEVPRYDLKGKMHLARHSKYYLADHAFRQAVLGTKKADFGRVYENMVAIELMRRGYRVKTGEMRNREIDFVVERGDKVEYIQVAAEISDAETRQREIGNLLAVGDNYPKKIITISATPFATWDGVVVEDLRHFLMNVG